MQAVIPSNAFVQAIAIVAFIFSICNVAAESENNIQLSEDALAFAAKLIKEGRFIADHKGDWTAHRPSAGEENEFIRLHGFAAYAKWHLGIDNRFPEHTKRRYKFPYGNFKDAHRCGLLAVKARARQHSYLEIEEAATNLERLIEQSKSGASALHKAMEVFSR